MSENGERLAKVEAELAGLKEAMHGHWTLDDERSAGLRREMLLHAEANAKGILKLQETSETSTQRIVERLGALERGEAGFMGIRSAATQFKASTLAVAAIMATILSSGVAVLILKAAGA